MPPRFLSTVKLPDSPLWEKFESEHKPFSFEIDLTARCNNRCRHCYISLPVSDKNARKNELSLREISRIADEAVELGAFWCLLSGGEPLLRGDFLDIYLALKEKGLLISVFTNATLITPRHARFFRKYPPRDIEVTVYGVTRQTYEKVTGVPGSFEAFMRGLKLCEQNGIQVRLKAMALRSNVHELPRITEFCRKKTKDYFRFDPLLHLRLDRDREKNGLIKKERLSADQIVRIEQADDERSRSLIKKCESMIKHDKHMRCNHLFYCGAGMASFAVSWDGKFKLCSSLSHPDCLYDLRSGTLREAWREFVPKVRGMRSNRAEFLEKCRGCELVDLCLWCPAHSYLETGFPDRHVKYFCDIAHARSKAIRDKLKRSKS